MGETVRVEGEAIPKSKDELISRIHSDWSALLETIEKFSHDQMITPGPGGWSTKDMLAHISFWERYLLFHHLQGRPSHDVLRVDKGILRNFDNDQINALIYERNRHNSVTYILEDLHQTHDELLAALDSIPIEDLEKPGVHDDRTKQPLMLSVISNTYEHYREHLKTILTIVEN
jgi:hypothetical protein